MCDLQHSHAISSIAAIDLDTLGLIVCLLSEVFIGTHFVLQEYGSSIGKTSSSLDKSRVLQCHDKFCTVGAKSPAVTGKFYGAVVLVRHFSMLP